ncbi:FAD-binding protein [Ahrensia sp. R2A130]|uniref:FAD-binding protein n=1 Tax=Ahrensia sp. R2A130 TaxID=744979 RepID=UPI0001E08C6E|nr:FAD-binding protein [Ahrensia sp. R2A130]EFL88536.1 glycolate oxidase, subunit GlcE [Ahrensia sp. R2A130]
MTTDTMDADLHPKTAEDVLAAVQWAAGEQIPMEIIGQGTKRAMGRPMQTAHTLELSGMSGVTLFEPEELVMTAKAGTPLAEIHALLAKHDQELQFEPADLGPLLGNATGQGTLGGMVNTNFAGPRRLKAGSARDHILGIAAVSGRGEVFKSGGRVVKNVTGYDLSKGVTGAWGTLAVLTDITMKVLPRAETEKTVAFEGLSDADASSAMATAMGSDCEVSSAAHMPAHGGEPARTLLRVEGFEASVAYRVEKLAKLLAVHGNADISDVDASRKIWADLRDVAPFIGDTSLPVWRISCTPSHGHVIAAAIANETSISCFYDWQGGLIWMQMEDGEPMADLVRGAVNTNGGGHATLIRATAEQRLATPVFHPQPGPLAALSRRYRENFDPHGVLNPGRISVEG